VSDAPLAVHTVGVLEVNVTTRPDVAVAESAMGVALNGWLGGPANVIVWDAFCTVSTNDCVAAPDALEAVNVRP
jgi:hypothetical protein